MNRKTMTRGMTGFGYCQFSSGKITGVVEIKSLNHRYLDINYYLPMGFSSLEDKIRQIIGGEIHRGKVVVSLKIIDKPEQALFLNQDLVRKYLKYTKTLQKDFGLIDNLTVVDVMKFPGVIDVKENLADPDILWPVVEKSIQKALYGLLQMRQREGKSLAADVQEQLKRMGLQVKAVKSRLAAILKEKQKTLTTEEFASFQKSSDINEEISRSFHFIEEVRLLFKTNLPIGKKMDFIAQEMQRETNTLGAKVQDTIVSSAVIALKSKIEKIREQSQNIE